MDERTEKRIPIMRHAALPEAGATKIIYSSANSHKHIFSMFVPSVQSFQLIAGELWEKLITQSGNSILKPNPKLL